MLYQKQSRTNQNSRK